MSKISNPFKFNSRYKPEPVAFDNKWNSDVGYLVTEFEAFNPNPDYGWKDAQRGSAPNKGAWPIIEPKHAPPATNVFPDVVARVLSSCWKATEPKSQRGDVVMGARDMSARSQAALQGQNYAPQVRPTKSSIETVMGNKDKIASDWNRFGGIDRANAVAFRGDSRKPVEVFKAGGFTPPSSRNDAWYLENAVFEAFDWYLFERYKRHITKAEFLWAVRDGGAWASDSKLLIEYTVWRRIVDNESSHLGRMVENECLKGYISCSTSIDSSLAFATDKYNRPGWLYLAIVHGGFIVPFKVKPKFKALWNSGEAEIAQWGTIPAERIVGFTHVQQFAKPDGPIFIRKSFRKSDPKAFETMFNVMSGCKPGG
ncbi:hypothetical protein DFR24_1571 [Panacagrimonas perspica]|uniref:Uncharacterized protein n=1 Tax=Panacagrimonas perspica TaxID=381431 RepID=A0A4S3JZR8_9GAMM|nr:hypothetical protein [Panacagrimonas perspica]TDU32182.1 hypothetical protein DFR24_1571 [Panacagrimonas perspica]THD01119.1 hypothetical protein B1810_21235 [Panacagrimonas perspica]